MAIPRTVLPEMEQIEVVTGTLKVTALPDPPPDALTVAVAPATSAGAAPKVMVWLALPMLKLSVAWAAAV